MGAIFGQIVPGRYVVELSAEPLAQLARLKGRSAAAASRLTAIESEQRRASLAIEQRRGRVLSAVNALMNGLVVEIADQQAAQLSSVPGAIKIYPVEMTYADLDHALPLHYVPDAWGVLGGMEKAGAGVKIAILDTGITPDHVAFRDPSMRPPSGYPLADKPENLALTNGKIIVARSYERFYSDVREPDTARDRFGT